MDEEGQITFDQIRVWDYYDALQHKFWPIEIAAMCLSGLKEESDVLNQMLKYERTVSKLRGSGLYDFVGTEPTQQAVIQWAKEYRHYFTPAFKEAMSIFYYEFVDDYLLMDTWSVKEAVCLIRGMDPSLPILVREKNDELAKYFTIAERSIDAGQLIVCKQKSVTNEHFEQEAVNYVSPEPFLKWAFDMGIIVPQKLIEKAKTIQDTPSVTLPSNVGSNTKTSDKTHGNKLINQFNRECILGAALCAVANYSKECKINGKFSGKAIVKYIENDPALQKLVCKDDDWIMETSGMQRLINSFLKEQTIDEGKKNLEKIFEIDTKKTK